MIFNTVGEIIEKVITYDSVSAATYRNIIYTHDMTEIHGAVTYEDIPEEDE